MVFYIVDDNLSIGIEKKKRCKTNKEGERGIECCSIGDWMSQHAKRRKIGSSSNAVALGKIQSSIFPNLTYPNLS